jgi:hypothetical protein
MKAQVVEPHFYVDMSILETSEALRSSAATLKKLDWMTARAWLRRELGRAERP